MTISPRGIMYIHWYRHNRSNGSNYFSKSIFGGKRLKENNSVFGTHIFSPKGFFWWHYKFTLYSLPTKYLFRNYWSSVNKQITTIAIIYKPYLQKTRMRVSSMTKAMPAIDIFTNWLLMGYHLIKYTYLNSRKLSSVLGKLIEATITMHACN